MKKVLSALCMALLVGGMFLTSCTQNKQYTITVKSNNEAWGTVTGGGLYDDQAVAKLEAHPKDGYQFSHWQDNVKDNPYNVTVDGNKTYEAYFEPLTPGVRVTFANAKWTAGTVQGQYFTSFATWQIAGWKEANHYPCVDVSVASSNPIDNISGAVDEYGEFPNNNPIQYIEYYDQTAIYFDTLDDGQPALLYGDWWAKNATVKVTDFDATALILSANVNATMFHTTEAFVEGGSVAAASTNPMNATITKCDLTANNYGGKKLAKKSGKRGIAKIAK